MLKLKCFMYPALFTAAFLIAGGYQNASAAEPLNPPLDLKASDDQAYALAQRDESPKSDSRWYKSREGRQEYLKGGGSYPKNQGMDSPGQSESQAPLTSDPRWHKTPSGRQDYLQGGRGSQHSQESREGYMNEPEGSAPPTSDPRWYKTPSGRQEYLQGGRGSQHRQN